MKVLNNVITMLIGGISWNLSIMAYNHITNTPNKVIQRDYQIEIKRNKALIYDDNIYKGEIYLFGQLDSLITKDNL